MRARLLLPAALAVTAVLLLAANAHRRFPTILSDEAGALGSARYLVRGPTWQMGDTASVDVVYPLLLAPVFAVVHSPALVYRLVVGVNVLLALALLAVLFVLARRGLGASPGGAVAAALCATAYPAVAMQAGVAWVEVAAMLGVACLLTTLVLAARRVTPALLLAHGTAVALLGGLHGRFTAVPVLGLAALLGLAVARRSRWALVAAGWALVLLVAVKALGASVHDARWTSAGHPDVSLDTLLRIPAVDLLRSASGQGWYLLSGTLGLALLGTVVLLRAVGRRSEGEAAGPLTAAYAGLLLASVLGISVAFVASGLLTQPAPRADLLYYGRYNECLVPTLVAVAVTALLQPRWRRTAAVTLAGAAAAAPVLLVTALATDDAAFTGVVQPKMLAAVDPLIGLDRFGRLVDSRLFPVVPTVVGVGLCLVLLALVVLRRQVVAPAVVLLAFAALTGSNVARDRGDTVETAALVVGYQQLRDLHPTSVAYDPGTVGVRAFYGLPFWLDQAEFTPYDSGQAVWPDADLYLGPRDWPAAAEHGLRRVAVERFSQRGVYAR